MGVLYDLINKGITDEEISTSCQEMRYLRDRVNELLSSEIQGLNIIVKDCNTYIVTIKNKDNSLMVLSYNKSRGIVSPISGFEGESEEGYLFCKAVKGQLFNTIKRLGQLRHRQTSITLKKGEVCNAYVYGSTLTLIEGKEISSRFDKLVLKNSIKNYESIIKL